ncbi:hypothetical protein SFRURICE_016980 [Spodoptera frugiperda]|nr:hypothetical protein SFRURICE_016980 [Spodoptera frugiperda]
MLNEEQDENMNCAHLLETFLDIMNAYNLYKKAYSMLIFYYSVDTFFRTVSYVESVLQLLLVHMYEYQILTISVIAFLENKMDLYKKVLQTNRTFSKMTACGLFYIDAMLPIRLLLLTTNYVIVLLQFAFL